MEKEKWQKNAESIVEKWKDILHLRAWQVYIVFEEELEDFPNHFAFIEHSWDHHMAQIHILNLDVWDERLELAKHITLDHVILHELLHLHMCKFRSNKRSKVDYCELAINQLTDAFLGLERKINNG